ncbi:MAG: hypothetical protein PHO63_01160 [Bacilli bacterium]|nr:hypothetical protein [Bacilli bacterium]MDD4808451.1 hypothetical protein [Bacilli bacterium]
MNNHTNQDFKIFGVKGYTVMSNYHLRDQNLSLKAKGLLSFMLSLPEDWDYSINGLVKILKEGRSSISATLDELKQTEYLKIEEHRGEYGRFKYKYYIYYLPYSKWLQMSKLTEADLPYTEDPISDNRIQINTNKQIDKEDKEQPSKSLKDEEVIHHSLTEVLINENYIKKNDSSSFYFDDLFDSLLQDGNEYRDLIKYTNYILLKLKQKNYQDEYGNDIENKYGYFKNAIYSSIKRFEIDPEDLFNPEDYDFSDDFEL